MKIILLSIIISFSFSSCIYKYAVVSAESYKQNEKNEFIVEDSTMRVTYNFNGMGGPVKITIYNKSGNGIQVDWKRSAIIAGEKALSYYSPEWKLQGTLQTDNARRSGVTRTSDINATITSKEGWQFIPPGSYITQTLLYIGREINPVDPAAYKKVTVKDQYGRDRAQKADFTRDNTPLQIKSYLSFEVDGNPAVAFNQTHTFYISSLVFSERGPYFFNKEKDGDKFYY